VTTASSLAARVHATIRRRGLLHGGETVLIAVSGGPDSVALLDVLCALRAPLGLTLGIIHVDHGLRPDSGSDAELVQALGEGLGVPVEIERVQVRRTAGARWQGLEAEARRLRYAVLAAGAAAIGAQRVATGHTADDQAETVLMRLLEGAGPRGLAGIPAERGIYVRPLIDVSRAEIMAHLLERGLPWRVDPSNRDLSFRRNRVRHELLPYLAERYHPEVRAALCRAADAARAAVRALDAQAAGLLGKLGRPGSCGVVFEGADLAGLGDDLASAILLRAAETLGEQGPLRAWNHRALRHVLSGGRSLRHGTLLIERSGRWLRVGPARLASVAPREWEVPGCLELGEIGVALSARVIEPSTGHPLPDGRRAVAFDADRLPPRLTVRGRRPGDRFAPFGAPGARRLKSFLIDLAIPRWERSRVPLLEAEGEILWVAGLRRGAAAPITPRTRRILEVTLGSPLVAHQRAE
jgi:tRNA(Ile)-lysidine synthase